MKEGWRELTRKSQTGSERVREDRRQSDKAEDGQVGSERVRDS